MLTPLCFISYIYYQQEQDQHTMHIQHPTPNTTQHNTTQHNTIMTTDLNGAVVKLDVGEVPDEITVVAAAAAADDGNYVDDEEQTLTTKRQDKSKSNNNNNNSSVEIEVVEADDEGHDTRNNSKFRCCTSQRLCGRHTPYHIGNCTVLVPTLYERTGYGIVGPHWIGLMFTIALIWSLTVVNVRASLHRIGIASAITCGIFGLVCTAFLFLVSCRDPGIVTKARYDRSANAQCKSVRYEGLPTIEDETADNRSNMSNWKWCDMCKVYQPPTGAHCMICNVCVEGCEYM